jgi:hypothetical protein
MDRMGFVLHPCPLHPRGLRVRMFGKFFSYLKVPVFHYIRSVNETISQAA